MDNSPGKVTKPLNHKGTLTTKLSCRPASPPVVMAILRGQLTANWPTHPMGGVIARSGRSGSQSSAGFVYTQRAKRGHKK